MYNSNLAVRSNSTLLPLLLSSLASNLPNPSMSTHKLKHKLVVFLETFHWHSVTHTLQHRHLDSRNDPLRHSHDLVWLRMLVLGTLNQKMRLASELLLPALRRLAPGDREETDGRWLHHERRNALQARLEWNKFGVGDTGVHELIRYSRELVPVLGHGESKHRLKGRMDVLLVELKGDCWSTCKDDTGNEVRAEMLTDVYNGQS